MEALLERQRALEDTDALRQLMREDGVILLRGVLGREAVEAVRAEVGEVLVRHGWVTDPETLEATDAVCPPGHPGFGPVYTELQALESFHRLAFESRLPAVVARLFDEDVFVHPGKVVRIVPPDPDGSLRTRPHQDFPVFQTTADTVTCWAPLVPCPPERGPLMLRPGSHRSGYRAPDDKGVGPFPIFLSKAGEEPGWATTTYQPGDAVLFHGLTVHASLANTTSRCRASFEFRYQSVADPIMAGTLRPNRPTEVPGWDVLTRGWSTTRWVEVPQDVKVLQPPPGATFEELLQNLSVPPSRFVPTA